MENCSLPFFCQNRKHIAEGFPNFSHFFPEINTPTLHYSNTPRYLLQAEPMIGSITITPAREMKNHA
jgi:hypothetical protein